jgi:HlyD family secretion protein
VSGRIAELRADFNSQVKKGEVIARLEPSLFQAQVEQARATLARVQAQARKVRVEKTDAEKKLARAKELAANQLIPASDLETAQTAYDSAVAGVATSDADVVQARASLNQALVNLDHTIIEAPIDGTVISRSVDVGQTVAASMQAPVLFEIAGDLSEMQVNASIDEADVGAIRADQPVKFTVDAYPSRTFTGRVTQVRLQPVVTQNVTTYTAVIAVPNEQLLLKPGMTATVTIDVAHRENVLRVPNAAVRFTPTAEMFTALGQPVPPAGGNRRPGTRPAAARSGAPASGASPAQVARPGNAGESGAPHNGRVWRLEQGKLVSTPVQLGLSDAAFTEIAGGPLAEGTVVVTGASVGQSASNAAARSPLLPQFPRRGGSNAGGRR